ncbi:hypothetical protein KCU77_g1625, partial [Aureobasidium melanogenum]
MTKTRAFSFILPLPRILTMEWDQLTWERFILGMPFLYEDLPFLRQFDNVPEVSLHQVLEILQPTSTSAPEDTREPPYAYAAHNQGEAVINSKAQGSNGRPKRMKRACKTCTQRKIKCNLISGHDPMVCEFCNKKGLVCEFEEKKVYTRSSA